MAAWTCDRCGKNLGVRTDGKVDDLACLYLDAPRTPAKAFYLCSACASGVLHYIAEPAREEALKRLREASERV